jgi:phosphoserine aminotransferase
LKLLQKESRRVAFFASRTRHIMRGEWRCPAEKLHSTPNSTVAPRPVQGWKWLKWGLKHEKMNGGLKATERWNKNNNRDYCDFLQKQHGWWILSAINHGLLIFIIGIP